MQKTLFKNRTVVISTMHCKEQVIQPILEENLLLRCVLPDAIDTDSLGTFSGEIPRLEDPLTTLRMKCELGLRSSKADLAIASEGSFGQHPYLFFAQANEEIVLLKDQRYQFEITGSYLTTDTNHSGQEVYNWKQALEFAEKALFPSHGLILKSGKNAASCIQKGITEYEHLASFTRKLLETNGSAWIETDMRALYNPTRMNAIRKATENLVEKLTSYCPDCGFPGFWITGSHSGLPCSACGYPTRSVYAHTYSCIRCNCSEERKFPFGRQHEDPMYCDVCNP